MQTSCSRQWVRVSPVLRLPSHSTGGETRLTEKETLFTQRGKFESPTNTSTYRLHYGNPGLKAHVDKVPDVGRLQHIDDDQPGDVGDVPVAAGAGDQHQSQQTPHCRVDVSTGVAPGRAAGRLETVGGGVGGGGGGGPRGEC